MRHEHRLVALSRRLGRSQEGRPARQEPDQPLEGRVRSKDFSAALLADIQSGARSYAAKHGNPFDWFGLERISSQKTTPVETCPYCVKGITDDDLSCSFCFAQGRLTWLSL
jgi:hypothetical protein